MFQRYSAAARRAVFYARYEAMASHEYQIGPHHLLTALLCWHPKMMARALGSFNRADELRVQLVKRFPPAANPYGPITLPLAHESKSILLHTAAEARRLWHRDHSLRQRVFGMAWPIRLLHLLLGILCEPGCVAAKLLRSESETLSGIRARVERLDSEEEPPSVVEYGTIKIPAARYSERLKTTMGYAVFEAVRIGSCEVRPEDFLLALAVCQPIEMQQLLGATHSFRVQFSEVGPPPRGGTPVTGPEFCSPVLGADGQSILVMAEEEAKLLGDTTVDTPHLLVSLLRCDTSVAARILQERGLRLDVARTNAARWLT